MMVKVLLYGYATGVQFRLARRQDRLDAIAAARTRLEQRQRDADLERGRSDDDDQKPRGQDGKPTGAHYKRQFGVPQDKDQDNFTDPDSRIMPRSGGGFDAASQRADGRR